MRNAVYAKDYSELARILHRIKCAVSSLRIQELELCNNSIKEINNIYLKLHLDIDKGVLKGEKNG